MNEERSRPSAGGGGQQSAATDMRARLATVTLDQWLALGVFLAAIAGSSVTWYALAVRCQFPPVLAAVPAIGLDLGGVVFGRNWILGGSDRLRTWGRITTILAVVLSVIGNGAEHAIAAGLLDVTLPMVVVVGSVPAAVLFAVVHQVALANAPIEAPVGDTGRVNGPAEVRGKRHGEPGRVNGLTADQAALAGDRRALDEDLHRALGEPSRPGAEAPREETDRPDPDTVAANSTARPQSRGTVVELPQRPTQGTLLDRVHAEYRRRAERLLAQGHSLDEIVLADIDRRAGAKPGYAKRHAQRWRAEIEAEQARQEG